jgi:hypothetical protein
MYYSSVILTRDNDSDHHNQEINSLFKISAWPLSPSSFIKINKVTYPLFYLGACTCIYKKITKRKGKGKLIELTY